MLGLDDYCYLELLGSLIVSPLFPSVRASGQPDDLYLLDAGLCE